VAGVSVDSRVAAWCAGAGEVTGGLDIRSRAGLILLALPFAIMTANGALRIGLGPVWAMLPLLSVGPAVAAAVGGALYTLAAGTVALTECVLLGMRAQSAAGQRQAHITVLAVAGVTLAGVLASRARQRRDRELEQVRVVAEAVQQVLLRPVPRQAGAVRLAARYVSASSGARVGGDLYEVVSTPDRVRLIVGDVQGKGLPAVQSAAAVLGVFREAAHEESSLGAIVSRVENSLARQLAGEQFVTAILAEVSADGGKVELLSCGHPAPVLVGPERPLLVGPDEGGLPLGLGDLADVPRIQHAISFAPGDALLFYTDGASEARNKAGEFFPLASCASVRAPGDPATLVDRLSDELARHVGHAPDDDVALLLVYRPLGRSDSARDLLFPDVSQALAQFDDQRIPIGQDALQAADRIAQQRASIAVAPYSTVDLGQPRTAPQRVRVTGAEYTLEPGPGLLAGQFRGRRLARLLVSGAEVVPRCQRVQVIGPQDALPVGHHLLVARYCLLCLAAGQVGVGQAVTRSYRLRVPGSLGALPVGQRAPVEGDGIGVVACGQVGGGEFVPRAERVGMSGSAGLLELGNRAFKDRDRSRELERRHECVAEAAPRLDHLTVIRPGLPGQAVEYPLEPRYGFVGAPGRKVGVGQSLGGQHRVRVPAAQQAAAGSGQVAPMVHRGSGQARAVQAVPREHQQGMAAAVPQQVCGDSPKDRHAGSQGGSRPAGQLRLRPGLEQRVRDRTRRLVLHAFGHRGPQRRLQHGADPDRRRCRHLFGGQQANLFQGRLGALSAG